MLNCSHTHIYNINHIEDGIKKLHPEKKYVYKLIISIICKETLQLQYATVFTL